MSGASVVSDTSVEPDRSAAPGSELSRLRSRIEQARSERTLDRPVPGMSELVVKFRTIGEAEREKIVAKYSKGNPPAVRYLINAELVATACIGIFERQGDELVPRGELLVGEGTEPFTFKSPQFQQTLGAIEGSATAAVRALYGTDNGDVIGLGDEIVQFSGFLGSEMAETIRGNS